MFRIFGKDSQWIELFNQSKAPNTFYKSKASNMVAVSDLQYFLKHTIKSQIQGFHKNYLVL